MIMMIMATYVDDGVMMKMMVRMMVTMTLASLEGNRPEFFEKNKAFAAKRSAHVHIYTPGFKWAAAHSN